MKTEKAAPRQQELTLGENELIVSKTDVKGRITYVNRTFMGIAGYSEQELLGQPHNIIRHPDMPRGAFKLMWEILQSGQEFMGYVKNLTKDGSYYWVVANVTPDVSSRGDLKGYYSVRRQPSREALQLIEPIYRQMLAIEAKAHNRATVDESLAFLKQKMAELPCSYNKFLERMENRG